MSNNTDFIRQKRIRKPGYIQSSIPRTTNITFFNKIYKDLPKIETICENNNMSENIIGRPVNNSNHINENVIKLDNGSPLSNRSEPRDRDSQIIEPNKITHYLTSIEQDKTIIMKTDTITYHLSIESLIGEGGFGKVYKCKNSDGNIYAVKKILTKKSGISCLMEASMFASYDHPYINKAIAINATNEGLYIMQNIAICDLYSWRRGKYFNILLLDSILYKIIKAISYLHSLGIIHGDIKSENVLYYGSDNVKLSDFSLCSYAKWKSNIRPCTASHRPIEVWKDTKPDWNEKIDIWSYGCLMYDLKFGIGLFPAQSEKDTHYRRRYINCILDWNEITTGKYISSNYPLKYPVDYKKPRVTDDFMHLLKNGYNDNHLVNLMMRCLQLLSNNRPSSSTVLSDPCFNNVRKFDCIIDNNNKTNDLDKPFLDSIKKSLLSYVDPNDTILLEIATKICANYVKKRSYSDFRVKKVCVWMAKKLIQKDLSSQVIPNMDKSDSDTKLLEMEIDICNTLKFKLH